MSATNSVIYESIYFSTNGITLFDTPFLPDFHGLRSASRTSKAVAKVASQLILPKNVLDTIYDTDLFVNLAEMKQSESLPQFQIILFLST